MGGGVPMFGDICENAGITTSVAKKGGAAFVLPILPANTVIE
jgi:hypothetical protein